MAAKRARDRQVLELVIKRVERFSFLSKFTFLRLNGRRPLWVRSRKVPHLCQHRLSRPDIAVSCFALYEKFGILKSANFVA